MVDGGGLENRFPERGRGFESYSLRHAPNVVHGCPEPYVVQGCQKSRMYYVYILKSEIDGNLVHWLYS